MLSLDSFKVPISPKNLVSLLRLSGLLGVCVKKLFFTKHSNKQDTQFFSFQSQFVKTRHVAPLLTNPQHPANSTTRKNEPMGNPPLYIVETSLLI